MTSEARARPIMSACEADGSLVEMIFKSKEAESRLAVYRDGAVSEHETVTVAGRDCVPYSGENNLLTHRVVLLPSEAGSYESDAELAADVQAFIHRYVDVEPAFEEVAAHYVLLSWVYDAFNEVPYLRVRGTYGSGKSRFLLTVGALCYKPIFASGASTVSPIFRLIDQIGGTLVVDEADFWASDERAEIVKILNNGNAKGFPVLRSEVTPQKEFNPRAFIIYGPKLVATRHEFEDAALESRCLTAVLGTRAVRADVPVTLPPFFDAEALALRNKLLTYRFRRFGNVLQTMERVAGLSARRAQILLPLLAVATTPEARERLLLFAGGGTSAHDHHHEAERDVLAATRSVLISGSVLSVSAIAEQLNRDFGGKYGTDVENRWVGSILRRTGVEPHKSHGIYVVPPSAYPHLRELLKCHGLGDAGDIGDERLASTAEPQEVAV